MTDVDPLAQSFADALPPASDSIVLLEKARAGDEQALNDLLSRYQERLRRIVRVRMGPGIGRYLESMDIVQDTYEVAWRKLANIEVRSASSILNWLARVAERQIQDAVGHRQAQKRDWRREVPIDLPSNSEGTGMRDLLEAGNTRPPESAARLELPELIDNALTDLPDAQREVVVLRDYCGGEWNDVAQDMEKTVAAARELHRRARIKLAIKLGPVFGNQA